MQADLTPFSRHFHLMFSSLELELTGYVILHKLLGFVFAVISGSLEIDAVAEVFLNEQYRPSLLFLIAKGSQAAGIDKCSLLSEIIT